MKPIVKEYKFSVNGIDAQHLYHTFKKICLAYEQAFHFGAPDEDEPNKYILELGNAVANILRGDIHDFLDSYYEDKLEGILGELYIQDAESGVDREIDYNSEDTIEKAQDIMDNLTNKTEILSEGDKS